MGIDIYGRWPGMTEEQKKAQYTGFRATGREGYLREAYHGGPYPSHVLVAEAFDDESEHTCDEDGGSEDQCAACLGVPIPATVLMERIPATVHAALVREAEVYGDAEARAFLATLGHETNLSQNKQPGVIELTGNGSNALSTMLALVSEAGKARTLAKAEDIPEALHDPAVILDAGRRFEAVRHYLAFVGLAVIIERTTGHHLHVHASY